MTPRKPLMPKATAVWLVENTALSFEQVAEFCGLHMLEVKGIADGDVAGGIKGLDPVTTGQLTREEITRAEKNPDHRLTLAQLKVPVTPTSTRKGPRYTPVSRRQDRPNAVLWLIRNHAEMKDSQIMRLVGTTKPTIQQIRDRSHWNSANLTPQDPVALGLCSQIDLDAEVQKAAKRIEKAGGTVPGRAGTLLPTAMTAGGLGSPRPMFDVSAPGAEQPDIDIPVRSPREEEAMMLAELRKMPAADDQPDLDDQPYADDQPYTDDQPDLADDQPDVTDAAFGAAPRFEDDDQPDLEGSAEPRPPRHDTDRRPTDDDQP